MIRIAFTDDHPVVMAGIAQFLETQKGIQIVGRYGDGRALLEGLEQEVPDVLFLDILLPDIPGNQLVRTLHKKYPKLKIIALTSIDTPYQIKDMMQGGCSGYLLKSAGPDQLIEAVHTVYNGGQYLNAELKEHLLNSMLQEQKQLELTKREREIIKMICEGETNNNIAEKLYLSLRTIENHRFSIYEKLGVNNTASLVKAALERGLA